MRTGVLPQVRIRLYQFASSASPNTLSPESGTLVPSTLTADSKWNRIGLQGHTKRIHSLINWGSRKSLFYEYLVRICEVNHSAEKVE